MILGKFLFPNQIIYNACTNNPIQPLYPRISNIYYIIREIVIRSPRIISGASAIYIKIYIFEGMCNYNCHQ